MKKENGYKRSSVSDNAVHEENAAVPEKVVKNQETAGNQREYSSTGGSSAESSEQGIIRAYLHDIARHSLLSREEEVAIAKEIEKGRRLIARSIVECPMMLRQVAYMDETLKGTDLKLSEPAGLDGEGDDDLDGELTSEDRMYGIREYISKISSLYLENKKLDRDIEKSSDSRKEPLIKKKLRNEKKIVSNLVKINFSPPQLKKMVSAVRKQIDIREDMIKTGFDPKEKSDPADLEDWTDARSLLKKSLKKIKKGKKVKQEAKRKLIESNLRLVVSIARKYTKPSGLRFLDLIQEGNIGLLRAVEKFEYRRGYKFSTYATWWIKQAITRSLMNQSRIIRIPVHMTENIEKIMRASRDFVQQHGREPLSKEVAEMIDMPIEKVSKILRVCKEPISLDTSVNDDKGSPLDYIEDTGKSSIEILEMSELKKVIKDVLAVLNTREGTVVKMRFGLDEQKQHTLEEVGKKFKVTRERVRQIEVKAIDKLRRIHKNSNLKNYN